MNAFDKAAVSGSERTRDHRGAADAPPRFHVFDIDHPRYRALIEPDSALWALVDTSNHAKTAIPPRLSRLYDDTHETLNGEMDMLRFHLKPSAVYFNPTERCNLNCSYCYIPGEMRKHGEHMSAHKLIDALARLKDYFATTVPEGRLPQVIFHGAEPLLNRDAVFKGIEAFRDDFRFGVQTNATLLDDDAVAFLKEMRCSVGLSLDAAQSAIADKTRKTWGGRGVFDAVEAAMARLRGYEGWSVICTMSSENQDHLIEMVDFLHQNEVPTCMLNVLRCTMAGARPLRSHEENLAARFIAALERSHGLYRETGRKMVVANFANILIAMLAPTARRLMCDISPCGGGRSFFALGAGGDLFPCSEFIGLPAFNGGNLFTDDIPSVLDSAPFRAVTERTCEAIPACAGCSIRHFCGAPCPAEAHEMNGAMDRIGAFCTFYKEQARYAFRLIADRCEDDFLWDGWDDGALSLFDIA
ncbi:peptide-modifying radical SAM enzyme CbpB [Varunaivibrio sulfuroxidans]|uniref:Radical SAM core domain-containing protein n=1 Tax=Varunaivibrio sulfuroxidans TaxID=1773489 RepID=A0A4R3J8F1_9PROT|nr:peptide-modifying radical SAM enzyme CbpB [Varunaivibrio sulfuroxidans]TCS62118.1 uncharacterized protein EDD55_10673 [Varunaivibrio sulfuroxidans]WES30551.1 peptide-modifying radical SAM enzyme CbpB [Varunaivibrio sulfuroxidans]